MRRGLTFCTALVVAMITLGAAPALGQQGSGAGAASSPDVAAR